MPGRKNGHVETRTEPSSRSLTCSQVTGPSCRHHPSIPVCLIGTPMAAFVHSVSLLFGCRVARSQYREPELRHDMTVAEVCTHCLQWVGGSSCKTDGLSCPRFPGARKWVALSARFRK